MRFRQYIISCVGLLLLQSLIGTASAQRVFVNVPNGFYELTGGAGNCTWVPLNNECVPTTSTGTYSMAVYKDTIYYLNGTQLYSFKIGASGSCQSYGTIGTFTSMTVDPNGILYFASSFLWRYDPYNNQLTNLGNMPFSSAGDLIFFNGKLLLAGNPPGIYEINIANPGASTLYMDTNGLGFFGLVSYPVPCGNSRYFGLVPITSGGTRMYELDLVSKTVLGNTCNLAGLNVYDAGSTTEGGISAGITITSLQVTQPCPPTLTGNINIQAIRDGFTVNYTLNGSTTNTTGIFNNLPIGQYNLHLEANGCALDTVINITPGLNPVIGVQQTNPNNCDGNNGSVTLTASTGHLPITYTMLNNGQQQANGAFNNLVPGIYQFNIKDAAGCSKDTTITLVQQPPLFVQSVQLDGVHCGSNTGFIKLNLAGGDTSGVTTSLSGAAFLPQVSYYNLGPGIYNIQAKRGTGCFFDTTVIIANIIDPKPQLTATVNPQVCYLNNGSINITAAANGYTFGYQLNGGGFGSNGNFSNLAPGSYLIGIRNQYGCTWDTTLVIKPYPKVPVSATAATINPDCEKIFNGSITVTATGAVGPYSLSLNNRPYTNGQPITGLTEGSYTITINDKDGCVVDSITEQLTIKLEPRCLTVYVPSAFTPNGDGRNDVFRPANAFFTQNMRLQVFNRYGQMIYNGTGPNAKWDGTYKGANQTAGAYVYWLTYTDYLGAAKRVKGNFILIR